MISSIIKPANRSVALRGSAALVPVELAQVGQHASDGFSRRRGCRPRNTRIPARTNTAALKTWLQATVHAFANWLRFDNSARDTKNWIFTYTYACDSMRLLAEQSFRIARCLRKTAIRSYLSILESVGSDLR